MFVRFTFFEMQYNPVNVEIMKIRIPLKPEIRNIVNVRVVRIIFDNLT